MSCKTLFGMVVFVAVGGLLTAASPSWAQITQSPVITTTPLGPAKTNFSGGLTFTKFDQSLGQLLSVQLNVQSSISSVLTVKNNSAAASEGESSTRVVVSVYDPAGVLPNPGVTNIGNPVPGAFDVVVNSDEFAYTLAPGEQITSGPLTGNSSTSATFTLAANPFLVSQFSGIKNSTITLGVGTFTRTNISNSGGNSSSSQVTLASAGGNVVYTYQPGVAAVPEPGMLPFALSSGMGLAGMVVRGRRASRRRSEG